MEFIEDRIAPSMDAKADYEEWERGGCKKAEELLNAGLKESENK